MTDQSTLKTDAPLFQPKVKPTLLFQPLRNVVPSKPTVDEEAELAIVTQLAGGVRPLHHKNPPKKNVSTNFQAGSDDEQKEKEEETKKQNPEEFAFPDGGWECGMCNNYNFKGRAKCFRCKKVRDMKDCEGKPKHIRQMENKKAKAKLARQNGKNQPRPEFYQQLDNRMAQKYGVNQQDKMGDWTCQRCFNNNYSFREQCNMCYLSHIESNRMLYSQAQQRLLMSQQQQQAPPQQYYQSQQCQPMMMQGGGQQMQQMTPQMQQQMMYAQQQQQMQYQNAMQMQQQNQMQMGQQMQGEQQQQQSQNGNNNMMFQQTGPQMFAPLSMQMQSN